MLNQQPAFTVIHSLADFIYFLKTDRWPTNDISLVISHETILASEIKLLAEEMEKGKLPAKLYMELSDCNLDDHGAIYFADMIKTGKLPKGFHLNLRKNEIVESAAIAIACAIESGKAPAKLKIMLGENKINQFAIDRLASAIKHPQAPKNLSLDLSYIMLEHNSFNKLIGSFTATQTRQKIYLRTTGLDDNDILPFLKVLREGGVPSQMYFDFSASLITKKTISKLFQILNLTCSHLPITFDLSDLNLSDTVANLFCEAFDEHTNIKNLTLILKGNHISNKGLEKIINKIIQIPSFHDLHLDLSRNEIDRKGVRIFLKTLDQSYAPLGFTIKLKHNYLDESDLKKVSAALYKNEMRIATLSCLSFHKAVLASHSLFSMLPDELLFKIYKYVFPFQENHDKKNNFGNYIFGFFNRPHKRKHEEEMSMSNKKLRPSTCPLI